MLEDTSFAIRPIDQADEKEVWQPIGDVQKIEGKKQIFALTCDEAVVNIHFYRGDIVRVTIDPFDGTYNSVSPAVIATPEKVDVHVREKENGWELQTKQLTVVIERSPFRLAIYDNEGTLLVRDEQPVCFQAKGRMRCTHALAPTDVVYGLGEKTGVLNKRGAIWTMWNTDVYAPHNLETDPLYQSHPYMMVLKNGHAHGIFFDHTYKTTFDLRHESFYTFTSDGGALDYYVFAGPHPKDVLAQYTHLVGRMPLPPKWALGYHQSRYSYETEQEVRELIDTFRAKHIPLDAVYLDIHYMDEYRVFTFDQKRFPHPQSLVQYAKEQGVHIVPIVDPGVKVDAEYDTYRDGVQKDYFGKYADGTLYKGDVWPGTSVFPDFLKKKVRKWWGEQHTFYTDIGIEGIWNDMNEPSVFNETKTMDEQVVHDGWKTHRQVHNVYGMMMTEATYHALKKQLKGKRPFVLTRAGFAGIHRYAAVWTGDNRSFWEHLELSIPMCLNLGLSAVAFCGADVGGFAHDANGELLVRWTQVGAFFPYFRNHCAIGFARQEPWAFGETYEQIIKRYIELRYEWLPHFYSLYFEAHQTGVPMMRPLMMEYPNDRETWNISDQFMVGNEVMVAPVMRPYTAHRIVYFPEGRWVDYWTKEKFEGGHRYIVEAPLDRLPIYVKEGAMIAHADVKLSTATANEQMTLYVYTMKEGTSTYTLYDDDGATFAYEKGEYARMHIRATFVDHTVHFDVKTDGTYQPTWQLHVAFVGDVPSTIVVNGEQRVIDEATNTFVL
ncbi:alpha-glucosidase [Anoxybacillus mongoliensis]|uniref:Alpha-glucosidase n=1 Tax=Anoxybacillus mongoliensis TaxID=452565 RepID=A0A7W8JEP8_9BACL|nr:glycoside hydrolase family 31 protein [Anoxybacillus mongoliensis]MBB5354324.1 alpha-glucosidase [Anoxybacillus mongoliensis]